MQSKPIFNNHKIYKQPISVLVIIYNDQHKILLLERADRSGFWQSITGSKEGNETLAQTALREIFEETGIKANLDQLQDWQYATEFEIYAHWRHRYADHVTHNTEHVFSLCIPTNSIIKLSAREHLQSQWCDLDTAVGKVFSPSNRKALIKLPQHWASPI